MDEFKGVIVVNISGSEENKETVERSSFETDIWNHCISSEFPIMRMDTEDEIATCEIGQPHFGFTMMAMIDEEEDDDDIILDGEAKIYDPSGQLCAEFYYEKGEATGECKLYYESGELYFDGYLEKGYRSGRGLEYSEDGEVIFDGFYKNGKRNPQIERNKKKRKYWNEIDDSGKILRVCKKNYKGLNYGTCYTFKNGDIQSISIWKDGIEIGIWYEFDGETMRIYDYGEVVYCGKYMQLSDFKYVTTGKRFDTSFSIDMLPGGCCHCEFCLAYRLENALKSCECYVLPGVILVLLLFGNKERDALFLLIGFLGFALYMSFMLWCMSGHCICTLMWIYCEREGIKNNSR